MRAWQLKTLGTPWEALEVCELPTPTPGAGEVRVRVLAADVNFADILQCQGQYQIKLTPPFVPGMSLVGEVVAIGEGSGEAGTLSIGDRIVGPSCGPWGGFAEQALVRETDAYRLPPGTNPVAAAAGHIIYATAWIGLHVRGQLRAEDTLLVLAGAGGVGSAAIQLAKARGNFVIAAAGGETKRAACAALGADVAIDYDDDKRGSLYEQVMNVTGGYGVDIVYDPVGGPWFEQARRLVAWEGRLLIIGFASGDIPQAPANHALVKNYSIVGVHMGAYRDKAPQQLAVYFEQMYAELAAHQIEPLIDTHADWNTLPQAMHRLATRDTVGRVLFIP